MVDGDEDESVLQSQVTSLTNEYTAAIATYVYTIQKSHHAEKEGGEDGGKGDFEHLAGQVWWGESARASRAGVQTADLCEEICRNDAKCSGATYSVKKKYCWTRQGSGPIDAAGPGEETVAIVPSSLVALNHISEINGKLSEANQRLRRCVERRLQPQIDGLDAATAQKHAEIQRLSALLAQHQSAIDLQTAELKRIDADGAQTAYSWFATLSFWFIIFAVLLVAILLAGIPTELSIVLITLIIATLLLMKWQ